MAKETNEQRSCDSQITTESKGSSAGCSIGGSSTWQLVGSMELVEDFEESVSDESPELTKRLAKTLKILFE